MVFILLIFFLPFFPYYSNHYYFLTRGPEKKKALPNHKRQFMTTIIKLINNQGTHKGQDLKIHP